MKKGKQKNSSKKKNFLRKYNERETKGNIQNTLLKGAVDTVAGSVIGTGLGAVAGDKAAFAGIALILAGHYLGDESGVLRLTGASTMAYGIGKVSEYRKNPEMKTASKRLGALKDDLLGAFFLKYEEEKTESVSIEVEGPNDELDLSGLDKYFDQNELQAENYSNKLQDQEEDEGDDEYDEFHGVDLTLI